MEDQETLWVRTGPGRVATFGIIAAVIAGGGVTAAVFLSRSAKHPPKAQTSSPQPSPSTSVGPIGVVEYEAGTVARVATVDWKGNATLCFDGSPDLELWDVNARTIVYADRFSLYSLPLEACTGKPTRLLTAPKPSRGSVYQPFQPWCAALSPDGERVLASADGVVSGFSVIGVDGASLRHVASTYSTCRWVDSTHGFVDQGDSSFAIDVVSGHIELLASPSAWSGSTSPGGRRTVFDASGGEYVFDHPTGRVERIADLLGGLPETDGSAWDPSGSRFISIGDSDSVEINEFSGHEPITRYSVPNVYGPFHGLGWFADQTLWFDDGSTAWIASLPLGFNRELHLPGIKRIPNSSFGTVFRKLLVISERPGVLDTEPSLLETSSAPIDSIKALRIGFQRPPSWTVKSCAPDCSVAGLALGWEISDPNGQGGPLLKVGISRLSLSAIEHRIITQFRARPTCRSDQTCDLYKLSNKVYGNRRITRLDIVPSEGSSVAVHLTALKDRTLIMLEGDFTGDVLLDVILSSLHEV